LEWEEVKKEIVEEKGIEPTVADKIGSYVKLTGEIAYSININKVNLTKFL
jgi:uncharacterized pyridoxamine 5'-phosphate oxidase family protein